MEKILSAAVYQPAVPFRVVEVVHNYAAPVREASEADGLPEFTVADVPFVGCEARTVEDGTDTYVDHRVLCWDEADPSGVVSVGDFPTSNTEWVSAPVGTPDGWWATHIEEAKERLRGRASGREEDRPAGLLLPLKGELVG